MTEEVRENEDPAAGLQEEADDTTKQEKGGVPGMVLAGVLHLALLVTVVQAFLTGWAGKWWLALGAVACFGISAAVLRKKPEWSAGAGALALGLISLVPAVLYGVDGAGLSVVMIPLPVMASVLLLLALGFSGWVFWCLLSSLPLWARLIPGALALFAAVPVVLGLVEGIPFGEVLVGLWTLPYWAQGGWIGAAVLLPLGSAATAAAAFKFGLGPARLSRKTLGGSTLAMLVLVLVTGLEMNAKGLVNLASPLGSWANAAPTASRVSESAPEDGEIQGGQDGGADAASLRADLGRELDVLENGFRRLAELRGPLTVEALASRLGPEADAALQWVRDSTRWVPYRGALRGSAGVLSERIGNSLDRSWLLLELLRSSGIQARLAQRGLSPPEAEALLDGLSRNGLLPAERGGEDLAEVYAAELGLDRGTLSADLRRREAAGDAQRRQVQDRAASQAADILATLSEAGDGRLPEGSGDRYASELLEMAEDHWWVQWRSGSNWMDLDPSSEDLPAPSDGPVRTFNPREVRNLDQDLLHRVNVRIILEGWTGGRPREEVVLEHSLFPAETGPVHLSVGHAPVSANIPFEDTAIPEDFFETIRSAASWQPILLADDVEVMGEVFSWPSDEASGGNQEEGEQSTGGGSPAAGLGGLFGGSGSSGSGTSRGSGSSAQGLRDAVTAEWIEYEIHVPGKPPQTVRRTLFDLVGPAGRASGPGAPPDETEAGTLERVTALMGTTDILVLPWELSDRDVEAQVLRSTAGSYEIFRAMLNGGSSSPEDLLNESGSALRTSSALLTLASARKKWSAPEHPSYLSEVNILSQHRWFQGGDDENLVAMESFDIVANPVATIRSPDADAFEQAVQRGVLDTNVEAALMGQDMPVDNVAVLHENADRQRVRWVHLRNPNDPALAGLDLPQDLRARIATDLAGGYHALVPEESVSGSGELLYGWWRIHPTSGQTLGMGPTGWGQSMTQRAQMEANTQAVTPAWAKALRATCDMFWCVIKEVGGFVYKKQTGTATKDDETDLAVNSFACVYGMTCQFFDIGNVPVGSAVCEVADRFLEALEKYQEYQEDQE